MKIKASIVLLLTMLLFAGCKNTKVPIENNEKESAREIVKQTTIKNLVNALWEVEIECPFPPFRMTRKAFNIDASKSYSLEEKANLIYRARELRRGRNLVVENRGKRLSRTLKNSSIPGKTRQKMARDFNTADVHPKNFADTGKGKKMVSYLNSQKVGVDGLIDYLIKMHSQKTNKASLNGVKKAISPFDSMTRDEQIAYLYRKQEANNRERMIREASPREQRKRSEIKKEGPPQKPYRANKRR